MCVCRARSHVTFDSASCVDVSTISLFPRCKTRKGNFALTLFLLLPFFPSVKSPALSKRQAVRERRKRNRTSKCRCPLFDATEKKERKRKYSYRSNGYPRHSTQKRNLLRDLIFLFPQHFLCESTSIFSLGPWQKWQEKVRSGKNTHTQNARFLPSLSPCERKRKKKKSRN